MRIETLKISDIKESPFNPRVSLEADSKEYQRIKRSILDFGFVEPIVVNTVNMTCVGGHQRLTVMRDMGFETIECNMVTIEDKAREKALCVALNKIKGEWDVTKLNELLDDEEIREFETGFDRLDVDLDSILEKADTDIDIGISEDDIFPESKRTDLVVKIGTYRFTLTALEYDRLIASIRDKGIFDTAGMIKEIRKRIAND